MAKATTVVMIAMNFMVGTGSECVLPSRSDRTGFYTFVLLDSGATVSSCLTRKRAGVEYTSRGAIFNVRGYSPHVSQGASLSTGLHVLRSVKRIDTIMKRCCRK